MYTVVTRQNGKISKEGKYFCKAQNLSRSDVQGWNKIGKVGFVSRADEIPSPRTLPLFILIKSTAAN